eukprot:3699655-Pleurochrysis_carterae.AAC.1
MKPGRKVSARVRVLWKRDESCMMQKLKQWCLPMQNTVIQARSFANSMMHVASGSTATWPSLSACRAV